MNVVRGSPRGLPVGRLVAVAATIALVGLQAAADSAGAYDVNGRGVDVRAALILAAAAGLVWFGRRAPGTAALGNVALTVGWYLAGYTGWLINIPYLISFYLLGATGDRRRQLVVGGSAVSFAAVAMLEAGGESLASAAAVVGWTMAAILLGESIHNRRALLVEYEDRAVRAEAERDAEAERRVADARLEIARDLHDVLAHTVSVMTVQAAVAQDALARGARGVPAALRTIRAAGREATEEIQALVAVLRSGADAGGTAPAPRLDRLGDLVAVTRAAGVQVTLTVDLAGEAASEVAELTAYRVVQESLTNVVRHAAARTAIVAVRAEGPQLVVDVHDDGVTPPTEPESGGFGLRGMRERVESLGGHLRAGPDSAGGWSVIARIPLERRVR